jgi:poly(A) polymerase/tRNA nucleotidyltransferase (CCA-adding enzyme)
MIPNFVLEIIEKLEKNKFEAFIVGGSVRDLLLASFAKASEAKVVLRLAQGSESAPKDWDLTTNARPEQVLKIFPDGKYENEFGTVILPIKNKKGETEHVVEITTYRSDQGYNDRRHPDEVIFEDSLDKDLERRDFTINAMALRPGSGQALRLEGLGEVVDLFGGQKDLQKRIIRAVGEPADRFKEDALRMMRAIRFSAQLGFSIEDKTKRNITKLAGSLKFVSNERIRDELIKILESDNFYEGMIELCETKLMQYILPELMMGVGVKQDRHHIYDVFKHSVMALKFTPSKDWRVRFASLLHDIGKVQTRKIINGIATFYNHEMVSAKLAGKIMKRLHFSNKDMEKIDALIRYHMFYYNVGEVTASSVRRLIQKVGRENLKDLIDLRIADRLGSGTPKAKPYKLRHLEYMMEKVQNDPVSVKMLKINGDYMIAKMKFEPGPKMGAILDVLLSEVIENPELNNLEYLSKRAKELNKDDIIKLRAKAKEKIEEKRSEDDEEMKKGYWVK